MAKIALRGVRKEFGPLTVLHGIDLEIAHGEFVVLVGPSGCGKSTLLRIVAGLETRTAGDVVIGDRVVNDVEPKDRDIAMVFQNYALYPHMSVYDNLAYGLRIRGMSRAEIETRVRKAAATLQIGQLLDRKPRQLSGGQRQRVAMGRAIVRDPAVFLFDEPLSNLDAKLRVQMRVEIKRLQQQLGVTAIYVTHDQVEAMTMADRLVVMNAGRAEQVGTPMEVYARPATQYVAGFIGSPAMNFAEARIGEDGRHAVLGGAAAVALDHARPPGSAVILGMRPEHLRRDAGTGALALRVDLVELLGADLLAYGELAGGARLVARLPGEAGVRAGDVLPLRIAPEAIHLFDPQDGARL